MDSPRAHLRMIILHRRRRPGRVDDLFLHEILWLRPRVMVRERRYQKICHNPDIDIIAHSQMHPPASALCAKFDRATRSRASVANPRGKRSDGVGCLKQCDQCSRIHTDRHDRVEDRPSEYRQRERQPFAFQFAHGIRGDGDDHCSSPSFHTHQYLRCAALKSRLSKARSPTLPTVPHQGWLPAELEQTCRSASRSPLCLRHDSGVVYIGEQFGEPGQILHGHSCAGRYGVLRQPAPDILTARPVQAARARVDGVNNPRFQADGSPRKFRPFCKKGRCVARLSD